MRRNPFHDVPGPDDLATLDNTQSIMRHDDVVQPICAQYRTDGLKLLGDRKVNFWEFFEELRIQSPWHHTLGRQAMGCVGRSRDVSRQHPLNEGGDQDLL